VAPVLQCQDRWGRPIALSEDRWLNHIIRRHGELWQSLSRIEQAVAQADVVNRDASRDDRELYYRHGILREPYRHLYLKVVVEFVPSEDGGIIGNDITAFPARIIKVSEVQRWP
jgi:hypothetical protein